MTKKRKVVALLIATLFTGSVFVACNDDDNKNDAPLSYKVIGFTDCKNNDATYNKVWEQERVEYSLEGNDLTITRYNETYNCCDTTLNIDIKIKGDKIIITELGDNLCNCVCQRDAKYRVNNIPKGHYTVVLSGWERNFEIDVR